MAFCSCNVIDIRRYGALIEVACCKCRIMAASQRRGGKLRWLFKPRFVRVSTTVTLQSSNANLQDVSLWRGEKRATDAQCEQPGYEWRRGRRLPKGRKWLKMGQLVTSNRARGRAVPLQKQSPLKGNEGKPVEGEEPLRRARALVFWQAFALSVHKRLTF